jgi:predicted RNA-binding protein with PIN domain
VARWLVDGMNVIGSRPDGWWRDRAAAMRRLTAALDALACATGEPVTVVFDGRPRSLPAARVDVRFASRRGPNAADDDIATLVAADSEPETLRVVTSDAALAARVSAGGARLVGASEFRRRLDEVVGRRDPRAPGRGSEGSLDIDSAQ